MPALTFEQIRLLNSYSIYTEEPSKPLFTLANITKDFYLTDFRNLLMGITGAATEAAAVSHFGRRYGMFVAMQFYMLAAYDEVWDGDFKDIRFAVVEEYGVRTFATFINQNDYRYVEPEERLQVMRTILYKQTHEIVQQLRKITSISPLAIWESIFGYILWHYHSLLENPALADQAFEDLDMLEEPEAWSYFSTKSLFKDYTGGKNPSAIINQPLRKSCCFSKDIPGLAACGKCPLI